TGGGDRAFAGGGGGYGGGGPPPPLRIQLGRLFLEEPVDVGVAAVDVSPASGYKCLDPRGCIAEGAATSLDEALVLLLGVSPVEGRPLEWPELCPDAGSIEVADYRFPDGGAHGIARVVARVEAVGVPGGGK